MPAPAAKAAAAPAAPGHDKGLVFQSPRAERLKHRLPIAADVRDDFHAGVQEHRFQRSGDGPADQHVDAELGEVLRPVGRVLLPEGDLLAIPLALAVQVHQEQAPGHVKDRGDPSGTNRHGDSHAWLGGATIVPRGDQKLWIRRKLLLSNALGRFPGRPVILETIA